jgi:hypothetical protein
MSLFNHSTCKSVAHTDSEHVNCHLTVFNTAESGEININLQKVDKGSTWDGALQGQGQPIDPMTKESIQKKIMLERFQEEV